MKHDPADDSLRAMEAAAAALASAFYDFRLYVTATSPQSNRAIVNIRRICTDHLAGRHRLEIVQLHERPELAAADNVIAAPTLVKLTPLPQRRFVGDMSDTPRILAGLGLDAPPPASADV